MKYSYDFVLIESFVQLRTFFYYADMVDCNLSNAVFFVRFNGNYRNDNQIKELLKEHKIKKYFSCVILKNEKSKLLLMVMKHIFLIFKKGYICRNFFIGDYYSKWMKIITVFFCKADIYYLDDGLASIAVYRDIKNKNKNKKINLITEFNLDSNDNCKVIKICRIKVKKNINNNQCLIIGMPMIEHQALISNDIYLSLIHI
ncbi:hypothetical protein, partial [Photobacterium phosphoreum]|uniref:hypothetical protein n=1 Tax=Photobacterium phosphoreum TaxID=659 RepID=UPI000D428BF4